MSYAPIDIIFFIIVIFFALLASVRGLIREFFSRAAFIVGITCAIIFTPYLEPYVKGGIKNELFAKIGSFILIFVIAFLVVKIIQEILGKIFQGDILHSLDKAMGLVFGIFEGLVVVVLLCVIIKSLPFGNFSAFLQDSIFYKFLSPIVNFSTKKIQAV